MRRVGRHPVRKMTSASHSGCNVVKAAWQPRVIFSVIWCSVGLLALYKGLVGHRQDLVWGSGICGLMWIAYMAWFSAFRLEIWENVVVYRSPLARTRSLPITGIKSATTRRLTVGSKIRSSGNQTLVLLPSDHSEHSIVVNARVFPPKRLAAFLDILATRGVAVRRT